MLADGWLMMHMIACSSLAPGNWEQRNIRYVCLLLGDNREGFL